MWVGSGSRNSIPTMRSSRPSCPLWVPWSLDIDFVGHPQPRNLLSPWPWFHRGRNPWNGSLPSRSRTRHRYVVAKRAHDNRSSLDSSTLHSFYRQREWHIRPWPNEAWHNRSWPRPKRAGGRSDRGWEPSWLDRWVNVCGLALKHNMLVFYTILKRWDYGVAIRDGFVSTNWELKNSMTDIDKSLFCPYFSSDEQKFGGGASFRFRFKYLPAVLTGKGGTSFSSKENVG